VAAVIRMNERQTSRRDLTRTMLSGVGVAVLVATPALVAVGAHGARIEADDGRRLRLALSVTLDAPVERPELRFSPGHTGRGIRLRPDASRFRLPSYRASQQQGQFDS
jgi:hypothetical protein